MTTYAYQSLHEDGLTLDEYVKVWGAWVEAKRQIAISTHYLIEERNDPYHRAWMRMTR